MKRKSLSVVLITRNEAELLPDCLASVAWADEIIVFDSGSIDETCQIALKAGCVVFQTTKWLGFGIQRQQAQKYAKGDYVFMIDADERVTNKLRIAIQEVLQRPSMDLTTVYSCTRRNFFLGRFMKHSGWYPDRSVRLYSRKHYWYSALPVHESLETNDANIVVLKGELQHLTCCDLPNFQHKQLKYAETWAHLHYNEGSKCNIFTIISHTYGAFLRTWLLRGGFLDGKQGWLLAIVNAQYTFNKYATLWALNHANNRKNNCDY